MPTDCHSSRCRCSSTSRTIGLFRTSLRIAYSNVSVCSITSSPSHPPAPLARRRAAWRCAPAGSASLRRRPRTIGRFVSTRTAARRAAPAPRNVCFTMRSSSEWKLITASRPPGVASRGLQPPPPPDKRVEPVELAVHPDPQRLKRPRRRIDPLPRARRPPAARWPPAGRSSRAARAARASTIARAMRRELRSSPNWKITSASVGLVHRPPAARPPSRRATDPSACRAARRGES